MSNPYSNALLAAGYIAGIGFLLSLGFPEMMQMPEALAPVVMLSLLVLSAALMAFLFFYRPVALLIAGEKEAARSFFLKTLGTFALFAACATAAAFALATPRQAIGAQPVTPVAPSAGFEGR